MKKLGLLLLIFVVALAFGCQKGEQAQGATASETKEVAKAASDQPSETAAKSEGKKVLAKVGDFEITDEYVDKVIASLPEAFRSQYLMPGGKKRLVEYLVDMEALYQEAKNKGLDKDPDVAFKLKFAGKQLLSAEFLQKQLEAISEPTEAEIEKFYEDNKDMFKRPEQARVRHILVGSREEAEKIKKELEGGADFAKLASEKSRDVSRVRGGELGWIGKGQTTPAFDQAIFTAPLNKPTIVETQFGFHVIEILDRRAEGYRDLAEVKDEIVNNLTGMKNQEKYKELVDSLRKKYNAEIFEDAFAEQ